MSSSKSRPAPSRDAVLELLREHGPMTQRQIADALEWKQARTHSTIANMRWAYPGQLIRVVGYVHDAADRRSKDQSLYAAEAGEDVPRPRIKKKLRRLATQARYREKNRARINARHRARRAAQRGEVAQTNPWSQLAPASYRSAVTQIEQHQRARASKPDTSTDEDE